MIDFRGVAHDCGSPEADEKALSQPMGVCLNWG
jgi:hypothetical protein